MNNAEDGTEKNHSAHGVNLSGFDLTLAPTIKFLNELVNESPPDLTKYIIKRKDNNESRRTDDTL